MTNFLLHFIQTGSTRVGEDRIFTGRLDLPLGPGGVKELVQMRGQYRYPAAGKVFSSPLRRCLETAALLFPGVPVEVVEELNAIDIGRFQGKRYQELKDDPAYVAWCANVYRHPVKGGEDAVEFSKRNIRAVKRIVDSLRERDCGEAAVVTHAGNISSICSSIGIPQRPLQMWPTSFGTGYTLHFAERLWLRDGLAEVHTPLPGGHPGAVFDTQWRDAD